MQEHPVVNNGYLMLLYITCFLTSLSVGFTLAGYNTAGVIIETQQSWPHINTVLITSAGILGLMLGSLACGEFISRLGRIKTVYLANGLILVSVVPQMWLVVGLLALGRFLLGFAGALCIVSSSVFLAETVPAWKLGIVGTAVNSGIIVALLITQIIQGLTLPNVNDTAAIATTTAWRIGFYSPGIFAMISIALWALVIRRDSLIYLIDSH